MDTIYSPSIYDIWQNKPDHEKDMNNPMTVLLKVKSHMNLEAKSL